jgi:ketosteroid isomerase-like protein
MTFDKAEHMRSSVEREWNHGDVAGFVAAFTEDAELQPDARYPEGGRTIVGKADITRFFTSIHRPVELGAMSVHGPQVMCRFRWADSAPDVAFDWAFLYRFDGERIVRARYYRDYEHARLAAQADPH